MVTDHREDREDASGADGVVRGGVPENTSGSARVRAWNWPRNPTGMFDADATDGVAVLAGATVGVAAFVGLLATVDPGLLATDLVSPFWTLVVPFLLVTPVAALVAAVLSIRRGAGEAPINVGTDASVAAGLYAVLAPTVLVTLAVGDVALFDGPGTTPMVGSLLLLLLVPVAMLVGALVGAAVAAL